jgi:hypothetical protein
LVRQALRRQELFVSDLTFHGALTYGLLVFRLDVIKDGVLLDTINLSMHAWYVVGRQPPDEGVDEASNFILMEHPSLSRKHAVFQNGISPLTSTESMHVYDLGSTHGTFVN